jgi:DeoR/GlpR family transcriptional regulator of sugar metabolism
MILLPRQKEILGYLRGGGGQRLEELCDRFGVSPATMRRDLARLSGLGLLRRVRGGALPSGAEITLPAPDARESEHLEEKRRVGAAAAGLVSDDSVIMLDAGTTVKQMVPHLAGKRDVTVITRDLRTALILSAYPHLEVICVGGTLYRHQSVAGSLALRFIEQFHADQFFVGAVGVSAAGGIWTSNGEEALIKLECMRRSGRTVLLADSTKIGRSGGTLVAAVSEADLLITDSGAGPDQLALLRHAGLDLLVV